jgi:hypothetical protein
MEALPNISLYLPHVDSSLTEKEMTYWLQNYCQLGAVEHIELIEELFLYDSQSPITAFVYFYEWYPTLGNQWIQKELQESHSITLPAMNEYGYSIPSMKAYKNEYQIIPILEGKTPISVKECEKGEEESVKDWAEIWKELGDEGWKVWDEERDEEREGWLEEERDPLLDPLYEEQMNELLKIMEHESFEFVDADYAACLEKQLSSFRLSTASIMTV